MTKSPQGTEYVNAQVAELKGVIDKYAEEISALSVGVVGLLYLGTFICPNGRGLFNVWVIGNGNNVFEFGMTGGANQGDGFQRKVKTGIPLAALPQNNISLHKDLVWIGSPLVGSGTVDATLSKTGTLTITVVNPHGRGTQTTNYYGPQD